MNTDERMLDVLQKTLAKMEELNTRLSHIENGLTSIDQHQATMSSYTREIERIAENNNIMG